MKKIKVESLEKTCGGCPTIFEWQTPKGKSYYFRLRHGYARITNDQTNKTIISGEMREHDGVCNWDDVKKWAKKNKLKLKEV
jgi:hypothetical protein